jgi:hypothetical protein
MFDQRKGPWRAQRIAEPEPMGPDRLGLTVRHRA